MLINGAEMNFRDGITVSELLDNLSVGHSGYIVVVDLEVIHKAQYREKKLSGRSKVDIVSIMGGG